VTNTLFIGLLPEGYSSVLSFAGDEAVAPRDGSEKIRSRPKHQSSQIEV
jgi:hypothetical protein